VEARPYVQSFQTLKCFNTTQADAGRGNRKEIAMYVDGQRYKDDLSGLDRILLPGQVFAAELYPDVVSAPFIWRTPDACAVIAFWTKR
jgi:hypothetical protein